MKDSVEDLDLYDKLTSKELGFLDDDEWLRIRRYRDFLREGHAETKSTTWVQDDAPVEGEESEVDEYDEEQMPAQTGGRYLDQAKLTLNRFEYMCKDWNLFEPEKDGVRPQYEFTRENRRKLVRKHGIAIAAVLAVRGYSIEPSAFLEGRVDADGKPLTFPKKRRTPAGHGRGGEPTLARENTA